MMPVSLQRIKSIAFLAIILSGPLMAQPLRSEGPDKDSLSRYIQMKYGLDQELFNGYQYYKRFLKYKGDPFFPEDSFYEGSVTIGGVEYEPVSLKYNSYSQYLILEYTDFKDRYNQLRLNNIHIDSFRLGTHRFQKLSLLSNEPLCYQEISSGSVACYIHWAKDIHATSDDLDLHDDRLSYLSAPGSDRGAPARTARAPWAPGARRSTPEECADPRRRAWRGGDSDSSGRSWRGSGRP